MVNAKPKIRPRKLDTQNSFGFQDINGSSNLDQATRPTRKKKEENLSNCGLCHSG